MCGIIAIVGKTLAEKELECLLLPIRHRGPDDSGTYQHLNVVLGHARLSIQDLSENGHQPMLSYDKRYALIFNGELYNHLAIRAELESKGQKFRSSSDTETLLYGLVEWGKELLPRLNGIFSFVFYDSKEQTILFARDHIGVKPLYYSQSEKSFFVSSELKGLLPFVTELTLMPKRLADYLQFLWCPGEGTPVKEIKKVLPGYCGQINCKENSILSIEWTQFYKLPFNGARLNLSENQIIDELDEKLNQAVERQLLSDVPVGFFLSGGLDSSLLVAIAKKITKKRLQCFTIKTDVNDSAEGFSDDLFYAKKVADHVGVDLEIVNADINIVRDFDKMIWHLDEPQADPAPLNVMNISERARTLGYKVLIGGTAGDDLFSGYRRHQALRAEPYFKLIPKHLGRWLSRIPLNQSNPALRRLTKVLRDIDKSTSERLANYYTWLPTDRVRSLFSKEHQNGMESYQPNAYLLDSLSKLMNEGSWLNKMLYWEMTTFLVDHNLNYTDKMGMAVGVEIRVPYLDIDLIEYAIKIPPSLKMKGVETKYILKRLAERYLPKEVIYRPKTGFGAPVRKWIVNDMREMIKSRLDPKRLDSIGLFDSDQVWKLINENEQGKIDASYIIWSLLAIDSWMQQFLHQKKLG